LDGFLNDLILADTQHSAVDEIEAIA